MGKICCLFKKCNGIGGSQAINLKQGQIKHVECVFEEAGELQKI